MTVIRAPYRPTALQIVTDAHDAMLQLGHGRGTYTNIATGELCLKGALLYGAGVRAIARYTGADRPWHGCSRAGYAVTRLPAYQQACRVIADLFRDDPSVPADVDQRAEALIVWYNDNACTGGEEALLLLKTAMHQLETQGDSTP